ncbi:MAG: hypothetical protein A2086_01805 [Spirochaetes bacterium GWD1_27_9]|nr:MAG: hypothetical protein A2Z98_09785 [Spirochaetes bacterium GWB1_27_13]OHD25667.1 MAG: hypothetical protein A2Y34_02240 [Spirochaetes bacterium GWC1_27_15]OHD41598.1 MAG: hypothetical protein A2086_01805 [Spirochaetes bacterium GWD1_27_9]
MVVNLSECREGKNATVKDIEGGINSQKRLKDLGILDNEKIRIVKNDKTGPIIIQVKGANIAIGRNISKKINVEVI